jgi:hypothetical protein
MNSCSIITPPTIKVHINSIAAIAHTWHGRIKNALANGFGVLVNRSGLA